MQVIKKNILYLDSFVNYIKNQKRLSVHTVRAYEVDINQLIQYLGNKKEITHLDKYDLNDYVNSISKHCSAKTLSRKVATLKSMFNFLCDEDLISHNLGKSINSPKVEKLLPKKPEPPNSIILFLQEIMIFYNFFYTIFYSIIRVNYNFMINFINFSN